MPTLSGGDDRFSRALIIQSLMSVATVILVAAPLAPILWQSLVDRPLYEAGGLFTMDNYARLFGDAGFYDVIWNSALLALSTTLVAGVLGVAFAIFLERTNLPGRRILRSLALWPMYISQLVIAFSWFMMYGPSGYVTLLSQQWFGSALWNLYSIPGMAVVAGTGLAPLVYLFCASSAKRIDATLEDAGRMMGAGSLRVIWSISIPLMRPAIIYSALLTFISSLEMLSVPLVFGRPVGLEFFTTYLYSQGLGGITPDYGLLGAAAAVLLAIISLLLVLQGLLLRKAGRFVTVKGKAQRQKLADLGPARWPLFAFFLVYNIAILAIPLAGIALRSVTTFLTPLMAPFDLLTTQNFTLIFAYPAYVRSITNSLLISALGGAIATAFVALVTLVVHRSEFRWRRQLEYVALYPRAIPGIVAGIGLFWAMLLLPVVNLLHGTIWILVLAFTMRSIPTAFGAISPALLQIGQELDKSARSCGADWWTTSRMIVLPLLKPAIFGAYVLLFLSFLKEYSSAVFLFSPGSEIIGTTMLSFWANGDTGPVAALSVIQLVITALFVFVARLLLRSHQDV
ncbi:ABC transporter permease [Sphingomonas oleivorans]|uniref:ABC transporter permease n=2 Tax=Sphingomonas oleivorans TaxID=1735121 RepID=A0A2T5G247_9SPHN|nr:ABC transporter permease [Sphingomonas oleivorans]